VKATALIKNQQVISHTQLHKQRTMAPLNSTKPEEDQVRPVLRFSSFSVFNLALRSGIQFIFMLGLVFHHFDWAYDRLSYQLLRSKQD
jgi:hypothetical protein